MVRELNDHRACKLRFTPRKQHITDLDKVINDKPYLMTELIVTRKLFVLSFFLKDASDEEPVS